MKIVNQKPPNYLKILTVFPHLANHKPVFCYGDTLFNPFEVKITPDIEFHESIHSKQQGGYPDIWWEKYLESPQFRLEQEIEAYGEQFAFAKKMIYNNGGNSKLTDWMKEKMAEALSGDLYGKLITYQEAESKIRNYGKNRGDNEYK